MTPSVAGGDAVVPSDVEAAQLSAGKQDMARMADTVGADTLLKFNMENDSSLGNALQAVQRTARDVQRPNEETVGRGRSKRLKIGARSGSPSPMREQD
jgi:hypothetical protein